MAAVRVGACLSLSGRYARFGSQAGEALRVWQGMADGTGTDVEVIVEDDRSSADVLRGLLPEVAARCDVLLGPYSTGLTRAAAQVAADRDLLLWNHGGAGDHAQTGQPGHVVSVPTPASRYAEPFLRWRAAERPQPPLWIVSGSGGFGRWVAAGAADLAARLDLDTSTVGTAEELPREPSTDWDLLTAGSFEHDIAVLDRAAALPQPPGVSCAVAAGVAGFRQALPDPDGIFGIAQWQAGLGAAPRVGPDEAGFVTGYTDLTGAAPDYPAVQAVAAAALATHCLRLAGSARRADLWPAATALTTRTLFGPFRIDPRTGAQTGHDTVLVRWGPTGEPRTERP